MWLAWLSCTFASHVAPSLSPYAHGSVYNYGNWCTSLAFSISLLCCLKVVLLSISKWLVSVDPVQSAMGSAGRRWLDTLPQPYCSCSIKADHCFIRALLVCVHGTPTCASVCQFIRHHEAITSLGMVGAIVLTACCSMLVEVPVYSSLHQTLLFLTGGRATSFATPGPVSSFLRPALPFGQLLQFG